MTVGGNGGIEVELRSVRKTYGRGPAAVDGVSLTIPGGRFVTLLGPSGSGKTTTLMMIAGFVQPEVGDVLIGGASMTGVPAHRRSIGVVFQHYALFPHMTVFDNIAYPLRTRRMARAEVAQRVRGALDLIQLPDVGGRYPRQLSGGQQQRVALARALVFQPSVLLMDEPLGALDRKLREQMQIELRSLQQRLGITTVSVTHDQEEAMALSDLVVVMRDGRIEQQGTPSELYERPTTPFIADFLGVSNLIEGELTQAADGPCFSTRGGLRFRVPTAEVGSRPVRHLMIRPERIRWADTEPVDIRLEGRVDALVYLGERIRYRLVLPDGQVILATRTNRPGVSYAGLGDTAEIGWKHDDVVFL